MLGLAVLNAPELDAASENVHGGDVFRAAARGAAIHMAAQVLEITIENSEDERMVGLERE